MRHIAKSRRLASAIGCLVALMTAVCAALADDDTKGRAELEKAARSLIPRASTDPTPVEFSVGGVQYRIPRNYIITMDNWSGGPQVLVTLRVNLTDMKPLNPEDADCFRARATERPPSCEPFRFWIEGKPIVSTEQAFENMRGVFRSQVPQETGFGFEKYEIGPEDARSEEYRKVKDGHTRLYRCLVHPMPSKLRGVCYPVMDTLSSGGTIHFFFDPAQLREIEEIDDRLRRLVDSFTASGENADGVSHTEPDDTGADRKRNQPGTGPK